MTQASALSPEARDNALDALAGTTVVGTELDVLVVGGGIVGAGTALDAATRGLATGADRARDLASGTSSRSSKLVHGGLRYLEMSTSAWSRRRCEERGLLLTRLAPHLVRPVPFLYPLHSGGSAPTSGPASALYDVMAWPASTTGRCPKHAHLSRKQVARSLPTCGRDAQGRRPLLRRPGRRRPPDAGDRPDRGRHGALVANRARVAGFLREGDRVVGVRALDLERAGSSRSRPRTSSTPPACGPTRSRRWSGSGASSMSGPPRASTWSCRATGSGRARVHPRTETSVLFVIPWGRHWIVGTTDTDWRLDKAHPAASARDIDYVLGQVNTCSPPR